MGQTIADLDKKSKYKSNKSRSKSTGSAQTAGFENPKKNDSGITASN
jgi:hypothetical protein